MSLVEQTYREMINSMTPAQKFERMAQLNAWGRWNIARRITEAEGEMPAEVLKWRVALWLYGHEPVARRLIEEQLARISHRRIWSIAGSTCRHSS